MGELVTLLVTSVLINNVILNQFLGMCPFMGVSKKRSSVWALRSCSLLSWLQL